MTDFLQTISYNNSIPSHQFRRLIKAFKEPLYLLEASLQDPEYHFKIVGSTKNVYLIKIDAEGKIKCDCPDQSTNCIKQKCICKHSCFLLSKVGKLYDEEFYYPESKTISEDQRQKIYNSCAMAHIDKTLLDKYKSMNISGSDVAIKLDSTEEQNKVSVSELTVDDLLKGETDCPICFSDLKDDEGTLKSCSSCPQCNKYLHTECIIKWLNYNSSCVFCRYKWTAKSFNHSTKKQAPSNYINLR